MTMQPSSIPGLNVRELHALVVIAHFGSLVGAAAFLQTSVSGLSRTVSRVEKAVGVRLFTRSTRRVELTSAGREFIAVSERVLGDLRIAVGGLRELATEQRGLVIISTLPIVVQRTLPELVRKFREHRPQVDVQVRAGYSGAIVDDVVGGVADFGIISGDLAPPHLERVDLRRESLYVVVPDGHPLGHENTPIRLAQLDQVPLILPPQDSRTRVLIEGAAAAANIVLRHAIQVPGFPEIVEFARAGIAPGIVPAGALPQPLPPGVHARLLSAPALAITVSMIRLAGRDMSPAAASFWALALNELTSQHYVPLTRFSRVEGRHSPTARRQRTPAHSPRRKRA